MYTVTIHYADNTVGIIKCKGFYELKFVLQKVIGIDSYLMDLDRLLSENPICFIFPNTFINVKKEY